MNTQLSKNSPNPPSSKHPSRSHQSPCLEGALQAYGPLSSPRPLLGVPSHLHFSSLPPSLPCPTWSYRGSSYPLRCPSIPPAPSRCPSCRDMLTPCLPTLPSWLCQPPPCSQHKVSKCKCLLDPEFLCFKLISLIFMVLESRENVLDLYS